MALTRQDLVKGYVTLLVSKQDINTLSDFAMADTASQDVILKQFQSDELKRVTEEKVSLADRATKNDDLIKDYTDLNIP